MQPRYAADDGLMSTPPPDAPCLVCHAYTPRQAVTTPQGRVWQCKRCLTSAEDESYEFDPRRVPSGREQGTAAARVLQLLVIGLRNAQEGPLDPNDLYEVLRPYFDAGWCVRDVRHALNQLPNGAPHPDTGWNDRLPRKQLLYRVRRRLREWRWAEREDGDDIMPGGWTEMRKAMGAVARRQEEHAQARDAIWHEQEAAARQAASASARQAARRIAVGAAARARQIRAEGERRSQEATAQAATQARRATQDALQKLSQLTDPAHLSSDR
ncbi:hypothetical protein ABZ793_28870 [Micromonospora sp. NPDC047465]|jgi:hypothetical protein|uniref:hypothetical protein n=1 Tax=unclassified Micromonospora TaxID=2617518 RepID=UPI0033FB4215